MKRLGLFIVFKLLARVHKQMKPLYFSIFPTLVPFLNRFTPLLAPSTQMFLRSILIWWCSSFHQSRYFFWKYHDLRYVTSLNYVREAIRAITGYMMGTLNLMGTMWFIIILCFGSFPLVHLYSLTCQEVERSGCQGEITIKCLSNFPYLIMSVALWGKYD